MRYPDFDSFDARYYAENLCMPTRSETWDAVTLSERARCIDVIKNYVRDFDRPWREHLIEEIERGE